MRKVLTKMWIPATHEKTNFGERVASGTGCWATEFTEPGMFHQWANAYEESSEGFGNCTVALVERSDGTMSDVFPSNLKFIEP
jgi:hypothetical protein